MRVNAVKTNLVKQNNLSPISNQKKDFNRIDVSFMGRLEAKEIKNKLSKDSLNMLFTPKTNTSNVSFKGMDVDKKNILVTGAAGYIGSHCAKYLLENGYNVVVLDNLSVGNKGAVEELKLIADENDAQLAFYEIDLGDSKQLSQVFKEHDIDAVMHFAAYSLVGESVKDPMKYYINNVGKTAVLIDEMTKANVKKIIFSSTAATYGEPDEIPILETTPQKPINPYGSSKLMIEKMLDDADKAHGLKSIRLRYFNVAGASSDGRLGEVHNPETHLIPNVLKPIAQKDNTDIKPFKLFGDDYPTPDGTAVRDYIHVEDLSRAHFLALQKLSSGGDTAFYNLGSSKGYSVREVYDACCEVTGKNIPLEITDRRPGDPPTLIASGDKAARELGFRPEKTLNDMISTAWNWIQNPKF